MLAAGGVAAAADVVGVDGRQRGSRHVASKKAKAKKRPAADSGRKKAAKKARGAKVKKAAKKATKRAPSRRRPQVDISTMKFTPKPWMKLRAKERVHYVGRVRYLTYGPGAEGTVIDDEYGNGLVRVRFDGAKEDELTLRKDLRRI
jgi:hypothetical protein